MINAVSDIPMAGLVSRDASAVAEQAQFDALLSQARGAGQKGPDDATLREAAEQLVAHAFLTPLMKMSRDSAFKSDFFDGGQGEKIFGAQLDAQYAETTAAAAGLDLVDAVYREMGGGLDTHA